jgi:radical SAM protein with 4Fe4S-binding SPASM domain
MVSLDAVRPETYRRIRRGGDLERVAGNVLDFLELRRASGRDLPLVRVSFVKMNLNEGERSGFHQFWKDRADYISYQEYSNILEREDTAFFTERRHRTAAFRCPDPWQRMSLFVNGDLFPCCSDFGRLSPIGNAYHQTVSEVWLSEAAAELRQIHRHGRWQEAAVCRRCALSSTGVAT